MSVTVGPRGARLNFSKRGVKQTVGIPGSGLSESSYIVKNEPESSKSAEKVQETGETSQEQLQQKRGFFPWGCLLLLMVLAIGSYLIAYSFHLIPPDFASSVLQGIARWVREAGM